MRILETFLAFVYWIGNGSEKLLGQDIWITCICVWTLATLYPSAYMTRGRIPKIFPDGGLVLVDALFHFTHFTKDVVDRRRQYVVVLRTSRNMQTSFLSKHAAPHSLVLLHGIIM